MASNKTRIRDGSGRERLLSEQAEQTLVRLDSGGFSLEAKRAEAIHVERAGEGWQVRGPGPWDGWRLEREPPDRGGGLRLERDGEWIGRSQAFAGSAADPGPRHVLLADGRLFCMVLCRPRNAYYELRGWESSGAYLLARPGRDRWTLTTTPAGDGLDGLDALQILFAAEIRQFDDPS